MEKSFIVKQYLETGHEHVTSSDFPMIYKNFNENKRKQKIAESLLIKQSRMILRARLHEARSKLKPVCDFTLGWNFTSLKFSFTIKVHMSSGQVKLSSVQI